ncbi:MAG: DUF58 domain-containing protein [Caldimicrobium sp.]|nr:DUF58 domain-containing protein [Caldimicrobium sp.]MDW8093968.1 DUF58 domain-containing protein [Caldimicrobium sp.]MDW8183123.1 DUF58 domain-containing protein [Caldimicrobium sp.]
MKILKHLFSSIRITKAGFLYTLVTIFLGISAVNTNNNILYVMVSMLLSFMWLTGVFSRLNVSRIKLEVLTPEEIFAGGSNYLTLVVKKRPNYLPLFLARIHLTISMEGGGNFEILIKKAFLKGQGEILFNFQPKERGRYYLDKVEISSLFPMAFFVRKVSIPVRRELIVFPKPKKCHHHREEKKGKERGQERVGAKRGAGEFEGIQEYLAGTPSKFISWKSLAKWDELKIKVFTEEERPPLLLDLMDLPGEDIEEKLSCACYLVLNAYKKGELIGLKVGKKLHPPGRSVGHKYTLLKELALYGKN